MIRAARIDESHHPWLPDLRGLLGPALMKLQRVSDNCFATLNQRACDVNSGLINLGGGVVIDTQADLSHARRMIELSGRVWPGTINDKAPGDLQMDGFMVSLVAAWHPLVEGAKRLKGE